MFLQLFVLLLVCARHQLYLPLVHSLQITVQTVNFGYLPCGLFLLLREFG